MKTSINARDIMPGDMLIGYIENTLVVSIHKGRYGCEIRTLTQYCTFIDIFVGGNMLYDVIRH